MDTSVLDERVTTRVGDSVGNSSRLDRRPGSERRGRFVAYPAKYEVSLATHWHGDHVSTGPDVSVDDHFDGRTAVVRWVRDTAATSTATAGPETARGHRPRMATKPNGVVRTRYTPLRNQRRNIDETTDGKSPPRPRDYVNIL